MSHTYRRKNAHQEADWRTDGNLYIGIRAQRRLKGHALAASLARFHADNARGKWTPPSWFARLLNKSLSAREKQALRRALQQARVEDWDVVDRPRKRGARWDWF